MNVMYAHLYRPCSGEDPLASPYIDERAQRILIGSVAATGIAVAVGKSEASGTRNRTEPEGRTTIFNVVNKVEYC